VNGRTAVGVEAASKIYFSKPASELDLEESALLAGIPQSPSLYNPLQNPRGALDRRNDVLDEMAEQDFITEEEAATAKAEPLDINPGNQY
jgi:penicillin-binding protein 1A